MTLTIRNNIYGVKLVNIDGAYKGDNQYLGEDLIFDVDNEMSKKPYPSLGNKLIYTRKEMMRILKEYDIPIKYILSYKYRTLF